MSETSHNVSGREAWTLPPNPHQEFEELCALSTAGELTHEEWTRLDEHLAHCKACRELKRQYERVTGVAMPSLAAESQPEFDGESESGSWSIEDAEARLMESLRTEPTPFRDTPATPPRLGRWKRAGWYALAALIPLACGLVGYQIGVVRHHKAEIAVAPASASIANSPSSATPPAALGGPAPAMKSAAAADQIARLQNEVRLSQRETAGLTGQVSELEDRLAKRSADLNQSLQDRAELSRELAQAQASEQGLETKLAAIGNQTSQDTADLLALRTHVSDLNTALAEKEKQIANDQELLQHDHDIRNVIGARNLYIAEIYDIAKNGDTEKPVGRVFYTKDKSLVFYGYDLDQQKGVRKDSVFQAWGRREGDLQHSVSLGLLYRDDVSQKRWVLKFNDAKTIGQIDAVFVTVEPEGGSAKPSGRPVLFTYLHLDPNHP